MSRNSTAKKRRPTIQAVDLFCGVGGLTHGMLRAGINVRAGVDIDPHCQFPFEANNQAKFIQSDVAQMQAATLRQLFQGRQITLLAGCAPCQPFSTYSRSGRNRHYETQWPLLLNFGRLVSELQPTLITMENVPQLLDHEVFNSFLGNLEGYSLWWKVVDCTSFRIPQTRKRLVLLGSKLGAEKLQLVESEHSPVTVRQTLGHLRSLAAGESDPNDPLHVAPSLSAINLARIKSSTPGGTWRDWPPSLRAKCHRKSTGQTYPSVYGRMEWEKPSPTITTQSYGYGNGRFGHPEQNRAITLREAAMIQTFPESYKFVASPSEVKFNRLGRLIGNAVPVMLGEEIAKALIKHVDHYQDSKRSGHDS